MNFQTNEPLFSQEDINALLDNIKLLTQSNSFMLAQLNHWKQIATSLYYEHDSQHEDNPLNCVRCNGLSEYESFYNSNGG